MGKIMNEKLRICRVVSSGVIPELGFIQGPIRKCRLNTKQIKQLISNGRTVYELNPANIKEEVKLTITNCATPQFEKAGKVEAPTNTPKEIIPPVKTPEEPVEPAKETVSDNNGTADDVKAAETTNYNNNQNKYNKYNKNKNDKKETAEKVTTADIQ